MIAPTRMRQTCAEQPLPELANVLDEGHRAFSPALEVGLAARASRGSQRETTCVVAGPLTRLHGIRVQRRGLVIRNLRAQRLTAGLLLRLGVDVVIAQAGCVSALMMRSERPRPRAASGRRLAPKEQDQHHHQDDDVPGLHYTAHRNATLVRGRRPSYGAWAPHQHLTRGVLLESG